MLKVLYVLSVASDGFYDDCCANVHVSWCFVCSFKPPRETPSVLHAVLPLAWPDRHRNHLDTGENCTRCITTGMTCSPQRPTETTWTLVKTAHAVLPLAWPVIHRDSQKPPGHWWKLHTLYYHWHDLLSTETHRNHLDTGENCTRCITTGMTWSPQRPTETTWTLVKSAHAVLPLACPDRHRDPQKPPGHWWNLHTLYYHWHDLIATETTWTLVKTAHAVLPLAWPVRHRDHRNHLDTSENCTRCITTGMTCYPQRPTEPTRTLVKTAHAVLPLAWPDRHRDPQKPPGHWWKLHTLYYHWHDLFTTETTWTLVKTAHAVLPLAWPDRHRNHLDTGENCTCCITTGMTCSPQRPTETTWTLVKNWHMLYYHWAWPVHHTRLTETTMDTGENCTRCITTGMTWSPQRPTETTWTLVKTAHAVLPLAWPVIHRDPQKLPGHWWNCTCCITTGETHRNHLDTGENCTRCITTGMTWSPQRTHRNHLDTGENCTCCITTGMTWSPQRLTETTWTLVKTAHAVLPLVRPTETTWTLVKTAHAVLPLAWPDRHRDSQKPPGHWWKLHMLYYHWHDLIATETHRNHLDTGENCTRCITTGMTYYPQRPTETTWTLVKTAHAVLPLVRPTETTWTLVKTAHAVLPLAWPDRHRDSQKPPGHWWKLHMLYYHWHDLIATETHRNHLDTGENCTRCITTGMTWSPQKPTETTWTLVKTAHAVLPLAWPDHHRDSQKPPGHCWKLHTLYYHWHDLFTTETHRNHLDTGENCTRCITTGMTWSPQRPTETTWTLVKTAHAVLPLAWPVRHRDPQKPPGHWWKLHTLYYHWHDLFATETHRNHLDTGENCTRCISDSCWLIEK